MRVRLSEREREREAVPLKQNRKKKKKIAFRRPITVEGAKDQDLQLSYINPAESGCSGQFALLSKLARTRLRTTQLHRVLTGRQQSQERPAGSEHPIYFMEAAHSGI